MINHGGPDPGIAHDYAHAFWTQERLLADQGNTDNRVMWFGPTPLIGDVSWANEALVKMDEWLSAVEQDHSAQPLADKVAARPARRRHRPLRGRRGRADAATCPGAPGAADPALHAAAGGRRPGSPTTTSPAGWCRWTGPRSTSWPSRSPTTSGRRWRPLSPTASATGRMPGVGQGPAQTWLRYDARDGGPAYGGRNLRPLPAHSATGVVDPVWAPMLRR